MDIKFKILLALLLVSSNQAFAADVFQGHEEEEVDSDIEESPLISNFLNPDENQASRKPTDKWERFKSLEEQGVNYIPSSSNEQVEPLQPTPPSEYSSDPFSNRMDYLEENLGVKKKDSSY